MTGATSTPDGRPGLGRVVLFAAAILRRRAGALVLPALALAVAPTLAFDALTPALIRAIVSAGSASNVPYAAYMGGIVLLETLHFVFVFAVVLVALEGDRPPGRLAVQMGGILVRLVPVAFAASVVGLYAWDRLPGPAAAIVQAFTGCWAAVVPVCAAERVPVLRLAARSWAAFAGGRRILVAVYAAGCACEVGLDTAYADVDSVVGRGGAAHWASRSVGLSLGAVLIAAVATAAVALYRELRRRERAATPPEVVGAFV